MNSQGPPPTQAPTAANPARTCGRRRARPRHNPPTHLVLEYTLATDPDCSPHLPRRPCPIVLVCLTYFPGLRSPAALSARKAAALSAVAVAKEDAVRILRGDRRADPALTCSPCPRLEHPASPSPPGSLPGARPGPGQPSGLVLRPGFAALHPLLGPALLALGSVVAAFMRPVTAQPRSAVARRSRCCSPVAIGFAFMTWLQAVSRA